MRPQHPSSFSRSRSKAPAPKPRPVFTLDLKILSETGQMLVEFLKPFGTFGQRPAELAMAINLSVDEPLFTESLAYLKQQGHIVSDWRVKGSSSVHIYRFNRS